jgi:TonB family protein
MRYCPTCETKYDDEVIRFCTKDGTPLVDASKPSFTDNLPSDSVPVEDDLNEETVIRRNKPPVAAVPEIPDLDEDFEEDSSGARIVIDTASAKADEAPARPAPIGYVAPPPKQTSVGLVIFFSVIGTLIVVIGVIGIYLLLSIRNAQDVNANVNANDNVNANENIDENFNSNELLDVNADFNANSNTNTSTPTPTPSPSPSPTESPAANTNTNVNLPPGNSNIATPPATNSTPQPRPTFSASPTPPPPPANVNRPVNVGTINEQAVSLPLPSYPPEARQVRASGRVAVTVLVDESGRVLSARATAGHPMLRRSAENAALRSRFRPFSVNGSPVPARGTIWYNFVD